MQSGDYCGLLANQNEIYVTPLSVIPNMKFWTTVGDKKIFSLYVACYKI